MAWLRRSSRIALICSCLSFCTSLTANAQLVETAKAISNDSNWPDDWYVGASEEYQELRNLEGKPAQEISVAEWRGDSTTLAALKGKIVVLDFWATWCGPCMAVIPKNVEFVNQYKEKGVALIGIHDAKSGWDKVDQVISDKGINYPVALDKSENNSGATTKAYALKFWPTYFVIDRDGIVRAAAIKPDKVHEVVDRLLSQSPTTSPTAVASLAPPDTWFLGGNRRLKSMRDREGKKAAALAVRDWIGTQPDGDDWKSQVRVVHFVRPEINASIDQLTKVQAVAERFARQGVLFVAVCDARSSREKMQSIVDDKRIEMPIALDKSSDAPTGIGATAQALGVKFSPTTVVIDRAGKVRAAGLKPDFLDKVLNGLLAEATPTATEEETTSEVVADTPTTTTVPETVTASVQTAQRPDDAPPPAP